MKLHDELIVLVSILIPYLGIPRTYAEIQKTDKFTEEVFT